MTATLTVRDASEPVDVLLTPTNLRRGIGQDPEHCVIAQGVRTVFAVDAVHIGTSVALIRYTGDDHFTRYLLSPDTRRAVKDFDTDPESAKKAARWNPEGLKATLIPAPEKRRIGARKGEPQGTARRSGRRTDVNARARADAPTYPEKTSKTSGRRAFRLNHAPEGN